MHVMINIADDYKHLDQSSLMILRVDAVYYDDEDRALVVVQGDYAYALPMERERHQSITRELLLEAKSSEYIDLSKFPGVFIETPSDNEDETDPHSVEEYKAYSAALEKVRTIRAGR